METTKQWTKPASSRNVDRTENRKLEGARGGHAILAALAAVAAVLLLASPLVAQEARPAAVVDEPVWDGGKVAKGEVVVHDFVIQNKGQAPLRITEVRPACGCTVADYDETIAPGESGRIHAELDTTDFNGGISKGMTVFTNDPENPRLILTMKATVEPYVLVRPGYARFIQPQYSDPGTVEQILFSEDFEDLQVTEVQSPYPYLEVKTRPATEEELQDKGVGNQHVITLVLSYENAPIGPLAEYVRLRTNHPRQPEVSIPVSGFVRPMMVPTPDRLELGSFEVSEEKPAKTSFLLKSYAADSLQVESAGSTVEGVDVQVEELEEGREFRVHVSMEPDMPRGPFEGVIRLKTGHPKNPTLEVPLSGTRL